MTALSRAVAYFVPARLEVDPHSARRARLVVYTSAAVLASQVVGLGYSVAVGLWVPAAVMAVAAMVFLGVPFALKHTGSLVLSANLIAATLFAAVVGIAAMDRGVETPLLAACAAVALVATLLAGTRSGLFWGCAAVIASWALFAAGSAGVVFPHMLPQDEEVLNSAMVLTALTGVVVAVAVAFDTLEGRALEELREVARELDRAREAAEASSRAKSMFLANMSHELRTPLTAIIGYSQMLADETEALPEEAREDLGRIESSGTHLLSLINDVLDLSKIEAGRMEIELLRFELRPVVDQLVSSVRLLAEKRGNRLEVELEPEDIGLYSDETRVRQVLMNLLSNAVKFTQDGVITVTGRVEGERLVLSVRDTGIGMGPDALKRVFEAFTQADESTTRRYGGTGLGLTISRRLAELLGGRLEVESEAGSGSTFTLALPVRAPTTADDALSAGA